MNKHVSRHGTHGTGRAGRMVAASAIAVIAAAGATLATASTASAVDSSGCNSGRYDWNAKITASSVNLRTGPSTSYASKGLLSKGSTHLFYCYKTYSGNQLPWRYIKVTSGPHKGVKGWIRGDYSTPV